MAVVSGPGPYRPIADNELRQIFHLVPQTVYALEMVPVTTAPPPGTQDARVTALLRRLLYIRKLAPDDFRQLAQDIHALAGDRQMIAISGKLLGLMRAAFDTPWAYPALLSTPGILTARQAASGVVDATRLPSNGTASTPVAFALSFLSRFAGTVVAHAAYMASLTNRDYDFRVQRMNAELNLRGVNADLAK